MARKEWKEIKATKPIEEWRKLNRGYDYRRRMKRRVTRLGGGLIQQISDPEVVKTAGLREALIAEVNKAMELPYNWGQEEYNLALVRLDEISNNLLKIKVGLAPKTGELGNEILNLVVNSQESLITKSAAVISAAEYMANQLNPEQVADLENTEFNCLLMMLRKCDGQYPQWLPRMFYNRLARIFNEEDKNQIIKWLAEEKNDLK